VTTRVAASAFEPIAECGARHRSILRFDENMACDPPPERDLHAMNLYEKWPMESAASREANGVARMNAKMIQPSLKSQAGLDAEDACRLPGA